MMAFARCSPLPRRLVAVVAATLALAAEPRAAKADDAEALLVGVTLLTVGVAAGAPGVTILAVCREGESCHSTGTTVAGWFLLAPGIPGIVLGGLIIAAVADAKPGGRSFNTFDPLVNPLPVRVAIAAPPPPPSLAGYSPPNGGAQPSGAMLQMAFSF